MIFFVKFSRLILGFIFAIIKLLPVQNKIVLASRQGNKPSVDFLLLKDEIKKDDRLKNTKVVILCKKLDKNCFSFISYMIFFFGQMYHIGTAKAVILDSYCPAVSLFKQRDEVEILQIWHALGALKKFGKSITGNGGEGRNEKIADVFNMHGNYRHVLVSSERCKHSFSEAFGCSENNLIIGSLPRVDLLTDSNYIKDTANQIKSIYPQLFDGKKIAVFAPTFRKGKDITEDIAHIAKKIGDDIHLVIKKHPLMSLSKDLSSWAIVDDYVSTMDMMCVADFVICDYSATIFEAALLQLPIYFYCPDLDEYKMQRSFYMDYETEMPGPICRSVDDLINSIKDRKASGEAAKIFADKYVDVQKGCTKQIVNFIVNRIDDAK